MSKGDQIIPTTEGDEPILANSISTLRYFKEDLPPRVASSKRVYKEQYQQHIYGIKMSENEKTRKIVAMVNSKKLERAKERKREKKKIQIQIEQHKKKQKLVNKRRHLEGQWRKKMMKLSVELKKGRIQEGHWRRHEWEKDHSGEIKTVKKRE